MPTTYIYSKSGDFADGEVNPTELSTAIEDSAIATGVLDGMTTDPTGCFIRFENPITKSVLDGLVAAHSGSLITDLNIAYFNAYDATGGTSLNTAATVPLDTVRFTYPNGVFTFSNGVTTINYEGVYRIEFDCSIDISTGTNRTQSEAWLERNNTELGGTRRPIYNRNATQGGDNMSATSIFKLNPGDTIRIRAERQSGTSNVQTFADGSAITIERIR